MSDDIDVSQLPNWKSLREDVYVEKFEAVRVVRTLSGIRTNVQQCEGLVRASQIIANRFDGYKPLDDLLLHIQEVMAFLEKDIQEGFPIAQEIVEQMEKKYHEKRADGMRDAAAVRTGRKRVPVPIARKGRTAGIADDDSGGED